VAGRLADKTAVVVGAGQTPGETIGNGRATAILFAREGARLLLVDRREDSARETQRLIQEEGGDAAIHVADVMSEDDCRATIAAARDVLGRIDILHNNVGIGVGDARPTEIEVEAWDRIFDVNLRGMWLTCKHAIPAMQEQGGGGAIVNISSVAAVASAERMSLTAYKASKAGVNAMTQQLAIAYAADGIRVNAIMPGLIDTPMAVDAPARLTGRPREELASRRASRVPIGRQGSAWDIAHAAVFLASDEAAFVTGVVLPVDGGQAALVG
jgi:NAD(P)-dependent dehydrogenase (short-subunit alcohol dehydrogenase family)